MTFPRVVLSLSGIVFVLLGVAFVINPEAMAATVSIKVENARAATEIAARYGGLQVGFGAFLLVAAVRQRWIRAGLGAQLLVLGGLASGRVIGLMADGATDRRMMAFAILEAIGAAVGGAAFVQAKRFLIATRAERRHFD